MDCLKKNPRKYHKNRPSATTATPRPRPPTPGSPVSPTVAAFTPTERARRVQTTGPADRKPVGWRNPPKWGPRKSVPACTFWKTASERGESHARISHARGGREEEGGSARVQVRRLLRSYSTAAKLFSAHGEGVTITATFPLPPKKRGGCRLLVMPTPAAHPARRRGSAAMVQQQQAPVTPPVGMTGSLCTKSSPPRLIRMGRGILATVQYKISVFLLCIFTT